MKITLRDLQVFAAGMLIGGLWGIIVMANMYHFR